MNAKNFLEKRCGGGVGVRGSSLPGTRFDVVRRKSGRFVSRKGVETGLLFVVGVERGGGLLQALPVGGEFCS